MPASSAPPLPRNTTSSSLPTPSNSLSLSPQIASQIMLVIDQYRKTHRVHKLLFLYIIVIHINMEYIVCKFEIYATGKKSYLETLILNMTKLIS